MNITHAVSEVVEGDKLNAIFSRQKELMTKYHDIEARSGLMQTEDCPVNLDDKREIKLNIFYRCIFLHFWL